MRKKRILFCSEATFLNTGYATYTREILEYLNKTGKYELAELASYGRIEDPRSMQLPWKYYGAAPSENATQEQIKKYQSRPSYAFGEFSFHEACLDFKPDIVCDIRDFWMLEFEDRSPYRKFYNWCIMPTVDAEPQAEQWMSVYKTADACLSYSDWSGDLLKRQSCGKINYIGSAPPSAHKAYTEIRDKEKCRNDLQMPIGKKIIGTVMRNQRRKLYPDLFVAFGKLLEKVNNPDEYILFCHTGYPDAGWDIPQLLLENKIANNVMFTYICNETNKPFASKFSGPNTRSPFTGNVCGVMPNVHKGLSYESLATIISSFDLYVQYANSEGFGLPQVEAAACGIPVASVDYSAMESVIRQLEGIPLKVKTMYKEMETGCMRAVPDNDFAAQAFFDFFQKPFFERKKLGFKTKQNFMQHFQWDKSGSVWEKHFDSVEIKPEEKTWMSKPDIQQPARKPSDTSRFQTYDEVVKFLICDVLVRPELLNSFLHRRMIRDMIYGFSTTLVDGMYINESSFHVDVHKKNGIYDFDKAYDFMYQYRAEINAFEKMRMEALNIR